LLLAIGNWLPEVGCRNGATGDWSLYPDFPQPIKTVPFFDFQNKIKKVWVEAKFKI
jgi:hypothetical protein